MVHAVRPGVSSGKRARAFWSFAPAACCQAAAVSRQLDPHVVSKLPKIVVPCWVPATATTSVTSRRSDGQ